MTFSNDTSWKFVIVYYSNTMRSYKFFAEDYFGGRYAKNSEREIQIMCAIHIMEEGL